MMSWQVFRELLDTYINVVRNPFYRIDDDIKSPSVHVIISSL